MGMYTLPELVLRNDRRNKCLKSGHEVASISCFDYTVLSLLPVRACLIHPVPSEDPEWIL